MVGAKLANMTLPQAGKIYGKGKDSSGKVSEAISAVSTRGRGERRNEMTQGEFRTKMLRAEALFKNEYPDYFRGYARGLRRKYHGERFGTEAEHEKWMGLVNDEIQDRREVGRGYQVGFIEI
jgi:hypothetical protein